MRYFDLATMSMTQSSGIVEAKQLIWSADGNDASASSTSTTFLFLVDGGGLNGSISSATEIFTLTSLWNPQTQFALETTTRATSGLTIYSTLWDMTTNSQVTLSQITNTSTTEIVLRSGKFTLIPGHQYGVAIKASGANNIYLSDASLIIFPS